MFQKICALDFVNENDQNWLVLHCFYMISKVVIFMFLFCSILFYSILFYSIHLNCQWLRHISTEIQFTRALLDFFTPIWTSLQSGDIFFFFLHIFCLTHWIHTRKYTLKVYVMSFLVKMVEFHFNIKFMNSESIY